MCRWCGAGMVASATYLLVVWIVRLSDTWFCCSGIVIAQRSKLKAGCWWMPYKVEQWERQILRQHYQPLMSSTDVTNPMLRNLTAFKVASREHRSSLNQVNHATACFIHSGSTAVRLLFSNPCLLMMDERFWRFRKGSYCKVIEEFWLTLPVEVDQDRNSLSPTSFFRAPWRQ